MPLTAASPRGAVSAAEFTRLMDGTGPFEPAPHVAVAVSGGADSMALALLASDWAASAGGALTALTIDHGLRPDSAAEARRVAGWLAARGIAHRVLRWTGDKPGSGVQAAARAARYDLLTQWCRRNRVLHLLLAHHRNDQAETFILRLSRGSGPDGLACMAAISETPWLRMIRPLLGIEPGRLRAVLASRGQDWIDDPSNRDAAYTRVRIRAALAASAGGGSDTARLAETARRLGSARAALEAQTAALLARAAMIHPAGFCRLDPALLAAAPRDIARRGLSRAITCIGGHGYAPRRERLERLHQALVDGRLRRPRTLGGCLITPRRDGLLIAREPGAAAPPVSMAPGEEAVWDGRFRMVLGPAGNKTGSRYRLGALGRDGWIRVAETWPEARGTRIPPPARPSLPALRDRRGRVVAVPHLGYFHPSATSVAKLWFFPGNALSPAEFSVV